jgi:oxygen-dependent protoporphyrinogen oxidase
MSGKGELQVAVVGGGITGLAAAHRILELGRDRTPSPGVQIFEASDRLGGVIGTMKRDGFLMEEGPDSLITEKPWALQLIERLGMGDRIVGTQDQHRRSFIVSKGRLHPTPEGFHLMAPARMWPLVTTPLMSPLGKLRVGLDLILPRRKSDADETLGQFVQRRLGREAFEAMAQPMISAIYGGDPMRLSLLATFPRFRELERRHGSIVRAMWLAARKTAAAGNGSGQASGARYGMFASLEGGLQVLTEELTSRIPEKARHLGVKVQSVRRSRGGRWTVSWDKGTADFDAVILALPAPRAGEVLRSLDEDLARRLGFVRYGTSATVGVAYREEDVEHRLNGFGFVVPAREGMTMLGCTFAHRKYAGRVPDGFVMLRAFHGGSSAPLSDGDLVEATQRDLGRLLGIKGEPLLSHITRYPESLPQYGLGHLDLVDEIDERVAAYPGLALAGNAYRGIGVPDCVRSGEAAAAAVLGVESA